MCVNFRDEKPSAPPVMKLRDSRARKDGGLWDRERHDTPLLSSVVVATILAAGDLPRPQIGRCAARKGVRRKLLGRYPHGVSGSHSVTLDGKHAPSSPSHPKPSRLFVVRGRHGVSQRAMLCVLEPAEIDSLHEPVSHRVREVRAAPHDLFHQNRKA